MQVNLEMACCLLISAQRPAIATQFVSANSKKLVRGDAFSAPPHQLQPRLDSTHCRIQELTSWVRKYVDDPILNGRGMRESCEDEAGSNIRYSFERLIRSLSKSSLTRTTSSGPVELDI